MKDSFSNENKSNWLTGVNIQSDPRAEDQLVNSSSHTTLNTITETESISYSKKKKLISTWIYIWTSKEWVFGVSGIMSVFRGYYKSYVLHEQDSYRFNVLRVSLNLLIWWCWFNLPADLQKLVKHDNVFSTNKN